MSQLAAQEFDFIVVGSGAGGGPLAANLARAGFTVLLIEAGGDPPSQDELGRLMYEVPIFHCLSTEYKECAWDFFVRHYTGDDRQAADSKFVPDQDGVWYPRAGTLGGCTAHNAMITVVPPDSDWDYIAELTGDRSWDADKMRPYFERLENCKYVPDPASLQGRVRGVLSSLTELLEGEENWRDWAHGHGFSGWLTTSEADPRLLLKDPEIVAVLLNGVKQALLDHVGHPLASVEARFDPNDSRNGKNSPEGLAFTPMAVSNGKRNGPREFILKTRKEHPDQLTIQLNALVTRVLFEGTRAVGVEFIDAPHAYRADPLAQPNPSSMPRKQVRALREVILAGGAFNSPQLLKLSGVGPSAELSALSIPLVADLPGVGENLQDRYEIGVISQFANNFSLLEDATFAPPQPGGRDDPSFDRWLQGGGLYASNGSLVGIIKRSTPDKAEPDLYIFGMPGAFAGYKPGYSTLVEQYRNRFTWAILKAHTNNTAGRVTLRSPDPWDRPKIEFHYFREGNDHTGEDLAALVKGVEFVRAMNQRLQSAGLITGETVPGPAWNTPDKLREFVQNEAWGHHASCTNKIGSDDDPLAVLDSRFRVRKTKGLRVVDASAFPRIPGYFIVAAVYMISEKASDVIIEDARANL